MADSMYSQVNDLIMLDINNVTLQYEVIFHNFGKNIRVISDTNDKLDNISDYYGFVLVPISLHSNTNSSNALNKMRNNCSLHLVRQYSAISTDKHFIDAVNMIKYNQENIELYLVKCHKPDNRLLS
jgi:hypothetical protein